MVRTFSAAERAQAAFMHEGAGCCSYQQQSEERMLATTRSCTTLVRVATARSAGKHISHDPTSRDHTMQCSLAMSRRHDPRPTRWHSHTTRCRTARSRMALSRSTAEPHSSIGESRRTAGEGPWSSGAALSVLSLLLHVPYVMICSVSDVKRHVRKSIISVSRIRK